MAYQYKKSDFKQRPQIRSENGEAFCAISGARIERFSPEHPFSIEEWRKLTDKNRKDLRDVKTRFCHLCQRFWPSTYVRVLCRKCDAGL